MSMIPKVNASFGGKAVEFMEDKSMSAVLCTDNRFEIIAKAKEALLDSTNIDTSPDEMACLDNFLFRCWQMGWLDKYDDSKDVVEVVRCKSCKWWNGIECVNRDIDVVDDEEYCSYGERK